MSRLVLVAKGDYDGVLEKYTEALTIFEKFLAQTTPTQERSEITEMLCEIPHANDGL